MRFSIDEKREILLALEQKIVILNSELKLFVLDENEKEWIEKSKQIIKNLIRRIKKDMEK